MILSIAMPAAASDSTEETTEVTTEAATVAATDGLSRTARNDLVAYSSEKGCAEVLLTMIPVYISDSFDASALEKWTADGIYSIYCEDRVIHYNDEKLTLKQLYQKDDLVYTAVLAE